MKFTPLHPTMSRDSSVGIATRYGLDGPVIESRWGRDFPHPSRPVLRPTHSSIQWVPGLSRGGRAAWAWCWPPTLSKCRGHERVGLYLYSPSGPQWPVIGWTIIPYYTLMWTFIGKECQYRQFTLDRLGETQHCRITISDRLKICKRGQ